MKPRRIVVRITSGLGNQMFQYACGLHISRTLGTDLLLDTSWFDYCQRHRPHRAFRLSQLCISHRCEWMGGLRRFLVALGLQIRNPAMTAFLELLAGVRIITEARLFQSMSLPIKNTLKSRTLVLRGYWQTADHYFACRDLLLNEFQLASPLSAAASAWQDKIMHSASAFIHVRRGDYVTLGGEDTTLPASYFERAAIRVRDALGTEPSWFIFSEDTQWCKKYLGFLKKAEIVEYHSPNHDIEDILLMSRCKAGVIANSSFSWWGAALGVDENRPIVAPASFGPNKGSASLDWLPSSWHRVPAWS